MQEEFNNKGCALKIFALLKEKGFRKLLLVTSKRWLQHESLHFAGSEIFVSVINPPCGLIFRENVKEVDGIENIDCLLAFGGGKTIDFAKGILFNWRQVRPYFMVVPTTAGSGSEATPFAVLYENYTKISIQDSLLLPDMVLLDPDLLKGMPRRQKAISAIDAFAQCIEALWNIHATPESDIYAEEGLRLILDNMHTYLAGEGDVPNINMMRAANLSGKAIAITHTTGPHALSYYLTSNYSVPHGQAVALFLPMFFIYNAHPSNSSKMKKLWKILGAENEKEAYLLTKEFIGAAGLKIYLQELQLERKLDLEKLIDSSNKERFQNNPVPFNKELLLETIRKYCY